MILKELHHCSIRTTKLEETREFYEDILGLKTGNRPDFPFPGYWHYLDGRAIIHVIGIDPDDPQGLIDYVGKSDLTTDNGTGPFDHVAFMISEPSALIGELKKRKVPYRERQVPNMDLLQVFLEDPNDITVELNYISADGPTIFDMSTESPDQDKTKTREELLAKCQELAPALRERSAKAEKAGRMSKATMKELRQSGLLGIVQPARVGGAELDYGAILEATTEISRACGSTGWVYVNLACHQWMLAMFPEEAQDDVWGKSPNTYAATSLIYPAGKAKKVKGGYELSGHWPFCSGIFHSDWIIVGGMVGGKASKFAPEARMFLVPKSELKLLDTWDVTGLAATGSVDCKIDKVFVPRHRTLAAKDVRGGPTPGSIVNPAPLYQLPVAALFPHLIAAPVLGMALGVIDCCVDVMRTRASTYNTTKVGSHATTQLRVSDALAAADAAKAVLQANCHEANAFAEAGAEFPIEARMRWRRDAAFVTTNVAQYADRLHRTFGGGALYNKFPLQRHFRDLHAALSHIGVSNDVNGIGYGRIALGLEADNPLV